MNKNRRISFLVKLKGLAQGMARPDIHAVGYEQNEWERNQIEQTLASWELWLQPDRLTDYHHDDFPDIANEEKERIPNLINKFDGYASRYPDLSEDEKVRACDALISLVNIFNSQLSDTHGEPGEGDNSE